MKPERQDVADAMTKEILSKAADAMAKDVLSMPERWMLDDEGWVRAAWRKKAREEEAKLIALLHSRFQYQFEATGIQEIRLNPDDFRMLKQHFPVDDEGNLPTPAINGALGNIGAVPLVVDKTAPFISKKTEAAHLTNLWYVLWWGSGSLNIDGKIIFMRPQEIYYYNPLFDPMYDS